MTGTLNQRVRTMPAAGGGVVVLGVWCPTCKEEQGPLRDGTCPFCDTPIYDEATLTARQAIAALTTPRPGGTMTATATRLVCKIDDCDETAEDRVGRYAKLCPAHKQDAKTAAAAAPRTRSTTTPAAGVAERVKQLYPIARRLDKARGRLEQLPSNQTAKQQFDEAVRRASATPTPDNLARVTETTKALQTFAPRRTKLETEIAEAERDFSRALDALTAAA